MPYRLTINAGAPDEKEVFLDRPSCRLGRSEEADIVIANKNVSGLHCSLTLDGGKVEILDLGSTNGTAVNGKKIKRTELRDGDVISIADTTIILHFVKAPGNSGAKTAVFAPSGEPAETEIDRLIAALRKKKSLPEAECDTLAAEVSRLLRGGRLLEALYGLLQEVLPMTEKDDIIARLLKEISALLDLEIGGIFLKDEERFFMLENGKLVSEAGETVVSKSVLRKVLDSKAPVILENIDSGDDVLGFKSLLRFSVRSLLCFPVLDRDGEAIGAFYCVSKKSARLRLIENDRRFLNVCSTFIALVLENFGSIEKEKAHAYQRAVASEKFKLSPIIKRLRQENENLSLKLGDSVSGARFWGLGEACNADIREFIEKAARTGLPSLITGETGVGKSLLAREIHLAAKRPGAFVTIDCTTIPADLLESELFGHEKGAFTGAYTKKSGKVLAARSGTLFIDEIGDLPPALQGKLLRLLQSGEYEPLGGSETLRNDAAIVVATNKDLKSEVAQKKFREDLFYRLNILPFELPPLRARPKLISPLAAHFLRCYAPRLNPRVIAFTEGALARMFEHSWPGNMRELENTVLRALANASGERIDAHDLDLERYSGPDAKASEPEPAFASDSLDLKAARERIDRLLITRALDGTGRNVSRAAQLLSLSRNSLMDLMKKYAL